MPKSYTYKVFVKATGFPLWNIQAKDRKQALKKAYKVSLHGTKVELYVSKEK